MKMVMVMEKNNRELLEKLRALKSNPNMVRDLNDDDLNNIFSVLEPKDNTENISTQNQSNTRGMMLTKTNPIYKGEETRENNKFVNHRIDGFAGAIILASITLLFGVVFLLIISNY